MLKSYRYRIYPNKQQEDLIQKTFGCVRFVYNQTLAHKKNKYETEKVCLSEFDCINWNNQFLKKEYEWLREVDKLYISLCEILKKCTKEELVYFNGVYVNHVAEDIICEKLNISTSSLKRIKKSCVIKIAMHFDIDVMIAS